MAKKSAAQDPFLGLWRIASMSEWDGEYLHKEVHAYIEFEPTGLGSFQFGYVQGQVDPLSRAARRTWTGSLNRTINGDLRSLPILPSVLTQPVKRLFHNWDSQSLGECFDIRL